MRLLQNKMKQQPTQWLMKMWLEGRMIVEVIHDQLAQTTGCWLRVQMFKQLLEPLDMSVIPAMDDMLPDMGWNELYPRDPHKASTICTQRVLSIIDVDKCIREPAWVEGGRRPSADGILYERAHVRTRHRSILLCDVYSDCLARL
jgi:hypothetical protein